jgi:hypothetical protein
VTGFHVGNHRFDVADELALIGRAVGIGTASGLFSKTYKKRVTRIRGMVLNYIWPLDLDGCH